MFCSVLCMFSKKIHMNKTRSFPFLLLVVYCPVMVVILALVYFFGSLYYVKNVMWGSGVSLVLIAATVFFTAKLIDRSVPWFLGLVIGGFAFRLLVIMGAGVYVHYQTNLHVPSFFCGLLGSYFLLQALEIIYLQRRFSKIKVKANEPFQQR